MSEQEKKTYAGDEVKGLFPSPISQIVEIESEKYGIIKFEVLPMDNETYAKMGQAMIDVGSINPDRTDGLASIATFGKMYYPMMKVIFPMCCVNPKVIDGVSTDKATISVKNMPMDVCTLLFLKILNISGLTQEADEERKN